MFDIFPWINRLFSDFIMPEAKESRQLPNKSLSKLKINEVCGAKLSIHYY